MSNGVVVDELVSLIKYEISSSSKQALADADKSSKKMIANANLQSKAMRAASGVTGRLVDHVKNLGIVSGVTSGIMAAWSINAGKEASRLTNLSQAAQVNVRDIQQLGSVYEQVGGNAKNFAADATAFFNTYGKKLDVEAMKDVAKTFSTLAPDMAQQLGKAYGFSDDMIRVLMKGPNAIQAMTDKAEQLGHVVKEEDIAALNAMNSSWNDLKSTISATSLAFQSGMADGMTRTFDNLSQMIAANQSEFQKWGDGVGSLIEDVAARVFGQKSQLQKDWEEIRNLERKQAEDRAKALKRESASLPDAGAVDETVGKIKKAKAEIPKLKKDNIWDTFVEALPVYSQRTISGSLNRVKQGYDRHNALNDTAATLDEARSNAIHGSSPEDKRWLATNSIDESIRKELAGLGWREEKLSAFKPSPVKPSYLPGSFVPSKRPEIKREDFLPKRELVGPSIPRGNAAPGGDYTNNSGNTSSSQTTTIYATIQVDGSQGGEAAGLDIMSGLQKAAYPGEFEYGTSP